MRIDGFDFELDDFQAEALEYINNGKSVVVCAPTGAGKTCIAEFAIQKALKNSERIFYTTPLKALSNQKFRDFGKKYGENQEKPQGKADHHDHRRVVGIGERLLHRRGQHHDVEKIRDSVRDHGKQ